MWEWNFSVDEFHAWTWWIGTTFAAKLIRYAHRTWHIKSFFSNPKLMNFPIKIFLLCPIPEEQKPINEYILSRDFLKIFFGKGIKKIVERNSQKVFLFSIVFFLFFPVLSFFSSAILSNFPRIEGSKSFLFLFFFFVASFFFFLLLFF